MSERIRRATLRVIQNGPAQLGDIIQEDEVEDFQVVDHMRVWEVDLRVRPAKDSNPPSC